MKIISNREVAIATIDVRGINCKELRQMHELNARIQCVLESHKEGSNKREYISDDDLNLMHAILTVFTGEYADTQTSEFDKFLKEQNKPVEKPEVLIKGGLGAYPTDMPIIGESKNF